MAVGVLEHGVPALQGRQRRQRPGPGALVADVVGGPVERVAEGAAGPVAQLVDLVEPGVEQAARVGERRAGAQGVEPGLLAGQPAARRRRGSGRGRARRCAAPRRRRARPAWRRRSGWRRGRRRPGRAAAVGLVADRGDDRACGPRAPRGSAPRRRTAAGPRPSRRRGRPRSRRRPALRSRRSTASITSAAERGPCIAAYATSKVTAGQRRRAFSSTSRSAALLGAVTSPTVPGRNGSGRLSSAANSPSAASSWRRRSRRASSSPRPTIRMSRA